MMEYNWRQVYGTAYRLEKDLGHRFKYKGPGWYETKTDTLLIQELPPVAGEFGGPEARLDVTCWNQPGGRAQLIRAFTALMELPTRVQKS